MMRREGRMIDLPMRAHNGLEPFEFWAPDAAFGVGSFLSSLLRRPVDGTVQQLAVHTEGGVVMPAQVLMSIVPSDCHVEIEAMISNRDIGFVRGGRSPDWTKIKNRKHPAMERVMEVIR